MASFEHIYLYTDGGSRPNPGAGAIGVVVCDVEDKPLHEFSQAIGNSTNNRAEYRAHIKGLELCRKYRPKLVTARSDSELLIKQLSGTYRIKDSAICELSRVAKEEARRFEVVHYEHVPRTHHWIVRADQLANEARDGHAIDRHIVEP